MFKTQNELKKELGIKTVLIKYNDIKNQSSKITFNYLDENGNLIKIENKEIMYEKEYIYINNKLTAEIERKEKAVVETIAYEYENNKKIKIVNGVKKAEYEYDNGLLIKKTFFGKARQFITNFIYDENNNLIRREHHSFIVEFDYDANNNNNISRTILDKTGSDNDREITYEYIDNKLVRINYDDGSKSELSYYENGLVKSQTNYDDKNNITNSYEFAYEKFNK